MFFPLAQITVILHSSAFFDAIGSNGQFFPGVQSSPTIFLKSFQEILSIGFAFGFFLGSSVYTFSIFDKLTTVLAEYFCAKRTASLSVEKPGFQPAAKRTLPLKSIGKVGL